MSMLIPKLTTAVLNEASERIAEVSKNPKLIREIMDEVQAHDGLLSIYLSANALHSGSIEMLYGFLIAYYAINSALVNRACEDLESLVK